MTIITRHPLLHNSVPIHASQQSIAILPSSSSSSSKYISNSLIYTVYQMPQFAVTAAPSHVFFIFLSSSNSMLLLLLPAVVSATTFTIVNKCDHTVWPGILSNAGVPPLSSTTGFALQHGETHTITPPTSWGGRLWGRTFCSQDSAGTFSCATADCGSGTVECAGNGAAPPATLAEFTLDGAGGMDFFDVSLVDGYNLPMLVVPRGGSGQNCTNTGCVADLNGGACPSELRVMSDDGKEAVACKSACEAFGEPEYCCSGEYGSPESCKPSSYSRLFKSACPRAYSYAYDDKSSTFTCAHASDYLITFCPSPNTTISQKSSQGGERESAMVYEGASSSASSVPSTCRDVMMTTTTSVAVWLLLRSNNQ